MMFELAREIKESSHDVELENTYNWMLIKIPHIKSKIYQRIVYLEIYSLKYIYEDKKEWMFIYSRSLITRFRKTVK